MSKDLSTESKSLSQLIAEFRQLSTRDAISPDTLGYLLQCIADALRSAGTFETTSQFIAIYDIVSRTSQYVNDLTITDNSAETLTLRKSQVNLLTGEESVTDEVLPMATEQQAGLMPAAELLRLKNLSNAVTDLADSIAKAGGIAPLDDSGKVPSSHLPSYVDDVVMFDLYNGDLWTANDNAQFVESLPEDVANLPSSSTTQYEPFLQYSDEIIYCNGHFYKVASVYLGHSITAQYIITRWDGCESFGTMGDKGIVPVDSKIYVARQNNEQYRWSGVSMIKLGHDPIVIGTGYNNACSGALGAQLQQRVSTLEEALQECEETIKCSFLQLDTINLTSCADRGKEPFDDITQALEDGLWFMDEYADNFDYWPAYGQKVTYLQSENDISRWVTYMYVGRSYTKEDVYLPTSWQLVVNSSSDGSGGSSVECTQCNQNAAAIIKLQNDVATAQSTADDAASTASNAKTNATSAKSTATSAKSTAETANSTASEALAKVQEMERTLGNLGGDNGSQWVTLSLTTQADSGWSAYSMPGVGSGFYPAQSAGTNIFVSPEMMNTMTACIILPNDMEWEGKTIRIIDPRINLSKDDSPRLYIHPYSSTQMIYGADRSSPDFWITMLGGYIELIAVRPWSPSGTSIVRQSRIDWVVKSRVNILNP